MYKILVVIQDKLTWAAMSSNSFTFDSIEESEKAIECLFENNKKIYDIFIIRLYPDNRV